MAAEIINATGWAELMEGKLIGAAFTMYNLAFMGWFIPILFIVFNTLLLIKTKNLLITFVTGIIFISLYSSTFFLTAASSVAVIYLILVFELASILYFLIWK